MPLPAAHWRPAMAKGLATVHNKVRAGAREAVRSIQEQQEDES